MKKHIFIFTLGLALALMSCEKELTKEAPFYSEQVVFESEDLTEAYIADLYNGLEFQHDINQDMALYGAVGAEYITFANWQVPNDAFRRTYSAETGPGPLDRWNYFIIRNMNYLLENIPNSQSLDEDYIQAKIAEVRFLRAFEYFTMVKRWGGVPLVTRVQDQDEPYEDLYLPRSTEKEIYDFIYSETEAILDDFDDARRGAEGRVDKYTVLMLQSRAMLYAASIARNGELATDGLTGIPASEADSYFQKSYDASMAIKNSGVFSLMNSGDDKVENYRSIFLTDGLGNPETIFAEVFEPIIRSHGLDHYSQPAPFNPLWNSNTPVIYDFVELFDFKNGDTGKIDRSLLNNSNEWDMEELFGNRDPRFVASVFYPESDFQGGKVWFHEKTKLESGLTVNNTNTYFTRDDGISMPQASNARTRRNTALLLRKRIDENIVSPIRGTVSSGQDYIVFRYAETLLNLAEAAFYLGEDGVALDAINDIRDRAGMPLRMAITEELIRHERQVELCFEDHRFWDIIRWRAADQYLDGVTNKGLRFTYVKATGKYIITLKNAEDPATRNFGDERYYLPFGITRLADNPELKQNPGY